MVMCTDCPRSSGPLSRELTTPSASEWSARQVRCEALTGSRSPTSAGHLVNGEIEHFQVTMKIGFRMEDPPIELTP
jgi:Dodecin